MRPTLVGLPYDASSSFLRGAASAPVRIREALASPSSNGWSESGMEIIGNGLVDDEGDLDLSDVEQVRDRIERSVRAMVGGGAWPIGLGGDHSVTYPVLRGLAPSYPRLTVLHIDAHADLYEEYEGDRYSHACPFARIMEEKLVRRLVQVGIRTLNGHQRAQRDRFGVEMIDMRSWAAGTRPELRGPLYLDIDLDALDPAFAPGVSHREPGGLTVRDVVTLIQELPGPIVGADVVEVAPAYDHAELTTIAASHVIYELLALMARAGG